MNLILTPAQLSGTVTPPPSKSFAHRLLIAAALTDGESCIGNLAPSQDVEATIRCMEALGARFSRRGGDLLVRGLFTDGAPHFSEPPRLDCGESGSTLRFLVPVALAVAGEAEFTGHGRLMERPMLPYAELFPAKGIRFEQRNSVLRVKGELKPGDYALPGNVSSQFFTGLLFALPLLDGGSRLVSTTRLESSGYLDMTFDALYGAGVTVFACRSPGEAGEGFSVPGPQRYVPFHRVVEADWSQAGFFCAAAGLGNDVRLSGMNEDSCQGDLAVRDWSEELRGGDDLSIDVSDIPDLVPPLAVFAALREGRVTTLAGAARLRMKESDRLASVSRELNALGARVEEGKDFLTIRGVASLHGGTAECHNDHRIAMMLAVAATRADGPVLLRGAECVAKSYPDFWDVYRSLGGRIREADA